MFNFITFNREKKDRILKLMDLDIEFRRLENEKLEAETKLLKIEATIRDKRT